MGSLSNFLGKNKTVEIEGQKVVLKPLTLSDLSMFGKKEEEMNDKELQEFNSKLLIKSIEGATEDDLEQLPARVFLALVQEIMEFNGFKDEKLSRIRELSEQAKTGK